MKRLKGSKKRLFKHERIYKFMKILRTNGDLPSASILARNENCTSKTVRRDISILRDHFGYNIEWDEHFNFYRLTGRIPRAFL